jgi:O-antigen/teichoic acid export membrane protein
MPQESRIKKSLLNARVNLIFYMLGLLLSFFSRKMFLDYLGADFMGMTNALYDLLEFLNLAELGIGSAIGYVLYKPLFEHNESKINEIISVLGFIYRRIGLIILCAGFILSLFLPIIFPNNVFDLKVIYFTFYAYLTSSLITYFANYKMTLLAADQKNYVTTAYFQTAMLVRNLVQMAIVCYTANYYLWILIELLSNIARSIILNWKIRQTYPWLKSEVKQGKKLLKSYPEVIKYTKQLFVHKMGGFVHFHTIPLLIYAFASLETVAFYGNYTIIINRITQLLNTMWGSTEAGVGNLIAEGDIKKTRQIFWELFSIRFLISGIVSFAIFQLTEPFIALWLGEQYVLSHHILWLIIISAFIGYSRGVTEQFLFGYGLFYDTWAPITEICLNLTTAVIGGSLWGLPGVLLGSISGLMVIVSIWKPYFLFKCGLKSKFRIYVINYFKQLLIIVSTGIICHYFLPVTLFTPQASFLHWGIYAVTIVLAYSILTSVIFYITVPSIRSLTKRLLTKLRKKQ